MTAPLRLFFDECISKPAVDGLLRFVSLSNEQFEFRHIIDCQLQGTRDEDWLPQIAPDGWIVITADSGKGGRKKGEKLPKLCDIYQVTHIVLTPRVHHQQIFDKTRSLIQVWDDLLKVPEAPRGSRFSLRMSDKTGRARLVLVKSPPPDVGL